MINTSERKYFQIESLTSIGEADEEEVMMEVQFRSGSEAEDAVDDDDDDEDAAAKSMGSKDDI